MRNTLFHIRRNSALADRFSLDDLLYLTCLSSVSKEYDEKEDVTYAIFSKGFDLLKTYFQDWSEEELTEALSNLGNQGLLLFDDDNEDVIYVGVFEGKRFEPFTSSESNLYDKAKETIQVSIQESKSIIPKARWLYLRGAINSLMEKKPENMDVGDFVTLHGLLYELYTGGESYTTRNKTEFYQIPNILKAYDKPTTFAIVTDGVLHYDLYDKRCVPTLIKVGVHKDDIFRRICKKDTSTKEYMRERDSDENDF